MLCAISGEVPQEPVVSRKSGNVFEKRLIDAYIQDNGKDPISNESLTSDDLIILKTSNAAKPRPPALTSVPSLLSVLQNEWDATALESFRLQQSLNHTRTELSYALYENDAAKRVIARLCKERDEARDALSKIGLKPPTSNGHSEAANDAPLPKELVEQVEDTQARLSRTRRKRPIPEDWVDVETVKSFAIKSTSKPIYPGAEAQVLCANEDEIASGGQNGKAGIFTVSKHAGKKNLSIGSPVTAVARNKEQLIFGTHAGQVKFVESGDIVASISAHADAVKSISIHPSGAIMASVSTDRSLIFYDVEKKSIIRKLDTDFELLAAKFHPDGHLYAAGGDDGNVRLYDVKTGANVATFDTKELVESLEFSENGIWLFVANRASQNISVWDLRKSASVHSLDMGGEVTTIRMDYSGQFLAAAGPGGLTIQHYDKSSKSWSILSQLAVPAVSLEWANEGRTLVALNHAGVFTVLGAK